MRVFVLKTHTPLIAVIFTKITEKHGPKVVSRTTEWGTVFKLCMQCFQGRDCGKLLAELLQAILYRLPFRVDFTHFKNHAPHGQYAKSSRETA